MKEYDVFIDYSDKKIDREVIVNIMYDVMINLQEEEKNNEKKIVALLRVSSDGQDLQS